MNKETVEEAAERYAEGNSLEFAYLQEIPAFKAGAKWQKEQSDSLLQKVIKTHSEKISEWGDAYECGYTQALKDQGLFK